MRVYNERGRDFRHTPSQVGLLARGHIKDGEYYSTCLRCGGDHKKSHGVQHIADNNALYLLKGITPVGNMLKHNLKGKLISSFSFEFPNSRKNGGVVLKPSAPTHERKVGYLYPL